MNARKFMNLLILAFMGSLTIAQAFPSWMGVYGAHVRYNTNENPGAYAILMNQDYFGLNAEVGIQVNGGSWNVYPMSYAGNVDGNSKWTFTPAQPYSPGSSIKFYFHGYDNGGGHIYDSRNGQNYEFAIPAGSTTGITWTAAAQVPTQPGSIGMDLAAYEGALYATWGTRSNEYNSMLKIWVAKKLPNQPWQAPQYVTEIAGAFQTPRIAVSASGLHLLLTDWSGLFYLRSENDGQTWSAPVVLTNANYAVLRADADYAYVIFNRYTAPDSSRMHFAKIYKNDSAFSEPVFIFSNVAYKTTVYVKDFDVSGPRVALLTYAQGWYGGYYQFFLHESQDGGATWTGGTQPGVAAHMALRPATGSISYLTPDTGPGGGGLYFQSKPAGWSSWKQGYGNVWPGEGTADALRWLDNKLVSVSQRNGLRYFSIGTVSMDEVVTWGAPIFMDGDNRWAVQDVCDGMNMHLLVLHAASNNLYFTHSTRSGAATPVQWIGNTYQWPANADLGSSDPLWINTESYPKGAAVTGEVVYSTNGSNWFSKGLASSGATPANDQWHANLGTFAAGTTVRYAVVVRDAAGVEKWDNNVGQDYRTTVRSNQTLPAPAFWGLDPFRYDNALVRVNGSAAYGGRQFGQFGAGQSITVVARPVENGNGNLVQMTCSIVSKLHYRVLPNAWSSAVTVTGVFHGAAMSNKPIFDYFSYSLGALPAGSQVEFWIEAENATGTAYAQSAGADYQFSIAAVTGDSDNDGLPDDWELAFFTNLFSGASDNPDNDGPIGFPIANILEWALDLNPTVPNDPMGIKLLWSPAYPQPGDTVTLSYFYVNQANPLFGKPIYGHVGHDGWQDVYDTRPFQPNGQIGRFENTIVVPPGATEINVSFHNNAGTWDNNGGRDWRIPVKPAITPPAAPAALASTSIDDEYGSTTDKQREPVKAETVTTTVKLAGLPQDVFSSAVVGYDGWNEPAILPLTATSAGAATVAYTMPAGNRQLDIALRAKNGKVYGKRGKPWTFRIVGNADQTLTIEFNEQ